MGSVCHAAQKPVLICADTLLCADTTMSTTTHNYLLPGLRTTATYLDFFFAYHFDLLLCADTTMSTTTHNYPLPGLRTTATYLDFFFAYHFDLCDHDQRCQRIPVR